MEDSGPYKQLADIEKEILEFWDKEDIFKKSLKQREGAEPFVFFEGPPTANGLPHIGHFLTRIYKDLYCRYQTMRGRYVLRRAGWDTHGLPVELEIEKELGFKTKKDIEDYGIAEFNAKCKESVWKYKSAWEKMTKRIGFWLDSNDYYITYDPKFMESVWWVIKTISDRGLLFQGHKVLPYCARCGTALSSHEVAQGYKEVVDLSVYVKFRVNSGQKIRDWTVPDDTFLLAWTTTPWTLPGNVALAVGTSIRYLVLSIQEKDEKYIIAEDLVSKILNTKYEILHTISGVDLVGLTYEPLFDIPKLNTETSYQVYSADFVSTEEGAGIVHTAVMYGEDDYELGKKYNLPMHHTVDATGHFTGEVPGFAGEDVRKEKTNSEIVEYLSQKGLVFKIEPYAHTYPFCWRCKQRLIYYAKDSWFIRMSSLRKELQERNQTINWVPSHIKEGRFGEFLKEAKDWALSRERYWGTPLPIWRCQKCPEMLTVGALEELEKYRSKEANIFTFVRHGYSQKNTDGIDNDLVASRLESDHYDLLSEGIKEIEIAADAIKSSGGADMIFASPFLRTRYTAEIIAKKLALEIVFDERLKEIDHGIELEGKPHANCAICKSDRALDVRLYDGETRREVRARMVSFVRELDRHHSGKHIIVVSHGDPLWLLQSGLAGLNDQESAESRKQNYMAKGEVRVIQVKNWPYNTHGELDMHRPFIDEIILKCSKCRHDMHRVKDIMDVWFDSGSMPYAQWHYPFENQERLESDNTDRQFPADWIVEGVDQTRGWFYTMLAIATALDLPVGKQAALAPYRTVGTLGFVTNDKGKKLSKSEGAGEGFEKLLDESSIDALRWYFYSVSDLGDDKRYAPIDIEKSYRNFHMTMMNTLRFYHLYPAKKSKEFKRADSVLDLWVISRLNEVGRVVTDRLNIFNPTSAARAIEEFVIKDLSQWWLRLSRPRFQHPADEAKSVYVSGLLRHILIETSKLMAPFNPFFAEHIYRDLKAGESVHLSDWSEFKKADDKLQDTMRQIRELVTTGLAWRKEKVLKVRQPLVSATLKTEKFDPEFEDILKAELNVKDIKYNTNQAPDIILDETLTPELVQEGYAREIMRAIQDLRKEAGYDFDQNISCDWQSDSKEIQEVFVKFGSEISKTTLVTLANKKGDSYDQEKSISLDSHSLWLGLRQ